MSHIIKYKFSKLEVEQFAMFEDKFNKTISDVEFQTEAQFSYDKNNKTLCSKIIVTAEQLKNILFKVELTSYFEISNESINSITINNEIVFPHELLIQFASLGYDSLRGIIHVKTLGTELNTVILPPLCFNNVIDKDFVAN